MLVGVLGALIAIGVSFPGREIAWADQWPAWEALRTTASIVFGVSGAWLAILFPSGLDNFFGDSDSRPSERVEDLLRTLLYSTLILATVLLAGVLGPVLKQSEFLMEHVRVVRGASMAVLAALTLLQLWTLIMTLVPAEFARVFARRRDDEAQARSTRFSEASGQDNDN
jgi:hypothetical protein